MTIMEEDRNRVEKTIVLPSSCLGCATRLVAFRDKRDKAWSSLYITNLSDHAHLYMNCWRGRFRTAWHALSQFMGALQPVER